MASQRPPGNRTKGPDAFCTIGEAAAKVGVEPHVLRFWETKFPRLAPLTRAGGRRYYRPADIDLLHKIKRLLHDDGMTIRGAQKVLRGRQSPDLLDALSDGATDSAQNTGSTPAPPLAADLQKNLAALAAEARNIANGGPVPRK